MLEHVEQLEAVVDLFRGLLTQRGRLVVSGPTESWAYRLGRQIAGFHKIPGYGIGNVFHHTHIYKIEELIGNHGFRANERVRLPAWPLPQAFESRGSRWADAGRRAR